MVGRLLHYPLILVLTGVSCLAMLLPAIHAHFIDDHSVARAFFYSSILGLVLVLTIGMAMSGRERTDSSNLQNLAALFLAYTVLPLFLALPFYEGLETTSFLNAYFEMVSSLTTTGATLFDNPARLIDSLHLWRALVGWMGGLMIWISAAAILASMSLGGFELIIANEPGQGDRNAVRYEKASPTRRLAQTTRELAPVYIGLTSALWIMMLISGEAPLPAVVHAMATLSTSGISSVGGLHNAESGFGGEAVVFLFMLFALSRLTFSTDTVNAKQTNLWNDAEFRIGLVLVVGIPVLLFLRHWVATLDVDEPESLTAALGALWGGMFTVLSFLSTTGFESASWETAQNWSGLGTPGLVLLGLSILGGGVATTAGGVKLLRVYALYLNGKREIERLVHPSSVGRVSTSGRNIRKRGAFVAWIFFMLFAISLALVTMIMAALGHDLEDALVLAIAALATAGPLTQTAADAPISLIDMSASAKLVLSSAMVLGRMETLAFIALFNPGLWRE